MYWHIPQICTMPEYDSLGMNKIYTHSFLEEVSVIENQVDPSILQVILRKTA
jgi:hypothetical protein